MKVTGASWVEELDWVVNSINGLVHSVPGATPNELWHGSAELRLEAHAKILRARDRMNQRLKFKYEDLKIGDVVLVYDFSRLHKTRNKLMPRWDGPYRFVEKLPGHLWRAKERKMGKRGCKKILVFHENFIHKFDYSGHVWGWQDQSG